MMVQLIIKQMKKIVISAALITVSMIVQHNSAKAQEGFQAGIEVTPQMSWLLNEDDLVSDRFEYLNNFNSSFGISAQYGFSPTMGLGINFLYSYQGQRYKFDGVEQIKKLEYLKIPIVLVINYDINPNWMFIGKIGPQLDVLSNARLTDKDGTIIVNDQKNAYEDIEVAGIASVGFGLKLTEMLSVDAALRGDFGFTNAENEDYDKNINHPNGAIVKTRAITNNANAGLTIGVRYLFK